MITIEEFGEAVRYSSVSDILAKVFKEYYESPEGVRMSVKILSDYYKSEAYDRSLEAVMDYYFPRVYRYVPRG